MPHALKPLQVDSGVELILHSEDVLSWFDEIRWQMAREYIP
jgi:hypothetical protein